MRSSCLSLREWATPEDWRGRLRWGDYCCNQACDASSPGLVHWACAKPHERIVQFSHTDLCPDYKSYGGFSWDHIKLRPALVSAWQVGWWLCWRSFWATVWGLYLGFVFLYLVFILSDPNTFRDPGQQRRTAFTGTNVCELGTTIELELTESVIIFSSVLWCISGPVFTLY